MTQRMTALLRGINVGGHRPVPMATLREIAEGEGLRDVRTYIQSGNLVFSSTLNAEKVARSLERAIADRFGFHVPVVVRTRAQWALLASSCPFPEAAEARPNLLHACLSQVSPRSEVVEALAAYCKAGEKVVVTDGALWIDYAGGAARSKLTPTVLDRAVGSPVTARNWKTVLQLAAMLG